MRNNLGRKFEGSSHGNLGVHGGILLQWILKKQGGKLWSCFIVLRVGANGWLLSKRSSGSINDVDFLLVMLLLAL